MTYITTGGATSAINIKNIFSDRKSRLDLDNSQGGVCRDGEKWYPRQLNYVEYDCGDGDIELLSFSVAGVTPGSDMIEVAGDQTGFFPPGKKFDIRDSTGNNNGSKPYVVASRTYADPNTEITLDVTSGYFRQSLPDATADGDIYPGLIKFNTSKEYLVHARFVSEDTNGAAFRFSHYYDTDFGLSYGSAGQMTAVTSTPDKSVGTGNGGSWGAVNAGTTSWFSFTPLADEYWEIHQFLWATNLSTEAQGRVTGGGGNPDYATWSNIVFFEIL